MTRINLDQARLQERASWAAPRALVHGRDSRRRGVRRLRVISSTAPPTVGFTHEPRSIAHGHVHPTTWYSSMYVVSTESPTSVSWGGWRVRVRGSDGWSG